MNSDFEPSGFKVTNKSVLAVTVETLFSVETEKIAFFRIDLLCDLCYNYKMHSNYILVH